jgi:protein-tyrosine phosphatase
MSIVDFHNHLIPGVDDGAQTLAEAEAGVAAFANEGVTAFAATPHVDAGLTLRPAHINARLAEIDIGWNRLNALCADKFPAMQVVRAAELLLDVPEPDLSDARVRINGSKYFLVEFPYMMVPPQSARVLGTLRRNGYTPILAHPERYQGVESVEIAIEWKQAGVHLQVNGGSLLGRYGTHAKKIAFELLEHGLVDYLCSDYHARGNPLISQYHQLLLDCDGAEQAHTLMRTNPRRLFEGQEPLPIAPLRPQRKSVWQQIGALFR